MGQLLYMSKDLRNAVEQGLRQGLSRDTLRTLAKQGGWLDDEVEDELRSFVDTPEPVAMPVRKPVRFAKESYLYLMQTTSYVVSAVAFTILWFQYLNTWLPDVAMESYRSSTVRELIRTGISMLVVAVPTLLLVTRSIRRHERTAVDAPLNATKQGVLYLGTFVASLSAAITLMVTVYAGLSGEATLRFLLKVGIILLVCAVTAWLARTELQQKASR